MATQNNWVDKNQKNDAWKKKNNNSALIFFSFISEDFLKIFYFILELVD